MKKVSVKYDKELKKYHVNYEKLKNFNAFRYEYFSKINKEFPLFLLIETHLGSVNEQDPQAYIRALEYTLKKYGLRNSVKSIHIRYKKAILGFIGNKNPIDDFSIATIIEQDTLKKELFDDVLCEYDIQIGYGFNMNDDQLLDEYQKGYLQKVDDATYFKHNIFDSRIFNKFLTTEEPSI